MRIAENTSTTSGILLLPTARRKADRRLYEMLAAIPMQITEM